MKKLPKSILIREIIKLDPTRNETMLWKYDLDTLRILLKKLQTPANNKELVVEEVKQRFLLITRQIDNLGRVVIPAKVRKQLNIKDYDYLKISVDNQQIIIEKLE